MSQKLPVSDFKWVEETSQFNENFIKIYNEDSDIGYFIEADVQYPEKLHELHNELHFYPKRIKIKKIEKLVANLHDKEEYVTDIINFKQALNQGLVLKKVHGVIKFDQKAWLKSYIDTDTWKNDFEKDFFKLMNKTVFGKIIDI